MENERPQCSRGWGGRCPASRGPRCKCACGGANHGNVKAREKAGYPDRPRRTRDEELFYMGEERGPARDAAWQVLRDMKQPPMGSITFARDADGKARILLGEDELPQRLVYHSPDGFEFGYAGSGPADLALNILALLVPTREAVHFHQMFKFDYIATAECLDTMPLTAVRGWLLSAYQFEHDEEQKAQRTREGAEQMEAFSV